MNDYGFDEPPVITELDDRIAVEVFGWQRQGHERAPQAWRDRDQGWHPSAKPWSSDIALAWLVVERLQEDGWQMRLTISGRHNEVSVLFSRWSGGMKYDAEGSTGTFMPALAICLAALKAVKVTV